MLDHVPKKPWLVGFSYIKLFLNTLKVSIKFVSPCFKKGMIGLISSHFLTIKKRWAWSSLAHGPKKPTIGWIYCFTYIFVSSMIHGDPTGWKKKNEENWDRKKWKESDKKTYKGETLNQ